VVVVLGVGLVIREFTERRQQRQAAAAPTPATEFIRAAPEALSASTPFLGTRLLVAARGWTPALQFALEASRLRDAQLLVLYISEVAVKIDYAASWQEDPVAKTLFNRILAEAGNVKINPLYSVSDSPAETIIDIAATFGVDTVVLGGSRRATLVNLLKGNVVTQVASSLPETMRLVVIG